MISERDVALFADLDQAELERIRSVAEEPSFAPGDIILKQGEPAHAVYVLLDGSVRVTAIMAEEDELVGRDEEVLVRLKPGDFFGELSFVDGSRPSLSVIAEQDVKLMALPHQALRRLLDSDAPLCRKILTNMMKTLAARLRDTDRELVLSRYFIRGG